MKENKTNNSVAIQDLLEYIDKLKQEQSNLQSQYKNLSANFVPVTYRNENFLDKIIPYRYKKFKKSYIESQRKERKLKNIDKNILLLQLEIEENENFLYRLQREMSNANFSQISTTEKTIANSDIEPSMDE